MAPFPATSDDTARGPSVVVAAGEPAERELLRRTLGRGGFAVVAACGDAEAAVAAAARALPRLCVIAEGLPGGALAAVRTLTAGPRPPRILLLGSGERERTALAGRRAGASGWLPWDGDVERLRAALDALAGGGDSLPAGLTARAALAGSGPRDGGGPGARRTAGREDGMNRFTRRRAAAGVAAVVAAAAVVAVPAATARTAGGSTSYTDPVGDSGAAADITGIVVSNDDAGRITVRLPGLRPLGPLELAGVRLDTDSNPQTGQHGTEVSIERMFFGASAWRWNGSDWDRVEAPSLSSSADASGLTFSFSRSDVGISRTFGFDAVAVSDLFADEPDLDWSPEVGLWAYRLSFAPRVAAGVATPKRPQAGKAVTVAFRVTEDGEPLAAGTVRCTARLAGKAIRTTGQALAGGTARCTWKLPTAAKGKTLAGSVTVTTPGGTGTRAFSAKVR